MIDISNQFSNIIVGLVHRLDYRGKKSGVVGGRFEFRAIMRVGKGKGDSSTREMATHGWRRREGPRRIVLSKDNASRRRETPVANARTRFLPHVFKLNRATSSWSTMTMVMTMVNETCRRLSLHCHRW